MSLKHSKNFGIGKKMTSKHIIIQTIKEIHMKKKRADIDIIAAGMRVVNLAEIKTTLKELSEEGVLKLTTC